MAQIFDTSFAHRDRVTRARHGFTWSQEDIYTLDRMFGEGASLEEMCIALQRSSGGVLPKLVSRGFLRLNRYGEYEITSPDLLDSPTSTTKGKAMDLSAPLKIENSTFVNGRKIDSLSDKEIYELISEQEHQISKLSLIKAQPDRLKAEIEQRQAGLDAFVKYLNAHPRAV
jgi:hypothetical protein